MSNPQDLPSKLHSCPKVDLCLGKCLGQCPSPAMPKRSKSWPAPSSGHSPPTLFSEKKRWRWGDLSLGISPEHLAKRESSSPAFQNIWIGGQLSPNASHICILMWWSPVCSVPHPRSPEAYQRQDSRDPQHVCSSKGKQPAPRQSAGPHPPTLDSLWVSTLPGPAPGALTNRSTPTLISPEIALNTYMSLFF